MIFAMSSISLLGSIVWGHHMYTIGLESDTRAYFTIITIFISLPTGTKIFNWLITYISIYISSHKFLLISFNIYIYIFLLMFTIGGATGIILGNSSIDLILHDTYYIIAHFHFILSLGAIISILSSISFNHNYIFINKNLLFSNGSLLSIYLLSILFFGIILLFSPMHLLGFNVIPRRIPDYPDSFHSWNFLSSIGSGITLLSFSFLINS
jgi:cytochrome c oxidase subunit 1